MPSFKATKCAGMLRRLREMMPSSHFVDQRLGSEIAAIEFKFIKAQQISVNINIYGLGLRIHNDELLGTTGEVSDVIFLMTCNPIC